MTLRTVTTFGSLAGIAGVLLFAACTTSTENYCDANTPCAAPGTVCDVPTKTCVPTRDGGGDGQKPTPDGIVDAPATPLKKGEPCGAPSHCESNFCVDGVCCETECKGACLSCALAVGKGECKPAAQGADPRGDCKGTDTACAGSCDGSGGCAFPKAGNTCGAPTCAAGELDKGTCNDKGVCVNAKQSCGGYKCADTSSCRTSCDEPAHCVSPAVCDTTGKICKSEQADGTTCGTNGALCKSGNCVDTVCCATASCAECTTCNGSTPGSCLAVTDGAPCGAGTSCTLSTKSVAACATGACKTTPTDCAPFACNKAATGCGVSCGVDADCATGAFCNKATSKCEVKKDNGLACGGKNECTSNICTTEGFCCNTLCQGDCETCNGKSSCSPKAKDTPCGAADKCTDGTLTSFIDQNRCAGTTTTCEPQKVTCDPYKCGAGAKCRTSCTWHTECTSGLCQLWDAATKNTCVPTSQICYVKAGAGGVGTQASPAGPINYCTSQKSPIIVAANGTYIGDMDFISKTLLVATATPATLGSPQDASVVKAIATPSNPISITTTDEVRIVGMQLKATTPSVIGGTQIKLRLETSIVSDAASSCIAGTGDIELKDVAISTCGVNGVSNGGGTLRLEKVSVVSTTFAAINTVGGALYARDVRVEQAHSGLSTSGTTIDIDRMILINNTSNGMLLKDATTGTVYNLVAAKNGKAGIDLQTGSFLTIGMSTFYGNVGTGAEVRCDPTAKTDISNSILWDTVGFGAYFGNCAITYSTVLDSSGGTGNIGSDPKFIAPTSAIPDLRLGGGSPCIDRGNDSLPATGAPQKDVLGNNRYFDAVSGGQKIDMGAYERQTP